MSYKVKIWVKEEDDKRVNKFFDEGDRNYR